jgi:hypothetical protein
MNQGKIRATQNLEAMARCWPHVSESERLLQGSVTTLNAEAARRRVACGDSEVAGESKSDLRVVVDVVFWEQALHSMDFLPVRVI